MAVKSPPDSSKVRSVVISNVYADDNRGGAALTKACIEAVEAAFPHLEQISLISLRTCDVQREFRHTLAFRPKVRILQPLIPSAKLRSERAILRTLLCLAGRSGSTVDRQTYQAITQADVVVSRGGVIFWQRQAGLSNCATLWLATFPLRLAVQRKIPLAIYGAHIGPLPSRLSRVIAGSILRHAYWVNVRDRESERLASSLGCAKAVLRRTPDSVTRLQRSEKVDANISDFIGSSQFAAFTIQDVGQQSSELNRAVKEVIDELLTSSLVDKIVLVSQVDGFEDSDRDAVHRFAAEFDPAHVVVLEDDLSVDQLIALYGMARCVVGMRLHSTIMALVGRGVGIPVDPSQSHKVPMVFAEFGLDDLVLPLGPPGEAAKAIRRILGQPDLRDRVDMAMIKAREQLLAAESDLSARP